MSSLGGDPRPISSALRSGGSFFTELVDDPKHGPLPALLLALTLSTGLIDSVSILSLGRVFVANMTGNIVFIGFALAKAPGFSLQASLVALAGFLVGAAVGGRAVARFGAHRGMLLRNVAAAETLLLLVALVVAVIAGLPFSSVSSDAIAALAALALGMQNAAVRKLAVPDLTTTVLTMTLTGIAADIRGGNSRVALRRILAVVAMLLGALLGGLLVLHVDPAWALASTAAVIAVVALVAAVTSRKPRSWQNGRPAA